jgi:hypothetical protein
MSYIGNQPLYTSYVTDRFSGNGSTLAYTLSIAPANSASLLVAIYGVLQDPNAYGVVGNTLTFTAPPPAGTNNISVRYLGLPASNVVTSAYRTVTDIIATAGQTTFSTASYTPGYIDVYRNGSKLATADYTATNGAQVVLNNAAAAGDIIQTVSFSVGSVLNALQANSGVVNSTYLADGAVTSTKLAGGSVTPTALDVGSGNGTGAMLLPTGTTGQRPGTPSLGQMRYNSTTGFPEIYAQGSWNSFGTVANGLTASTPFTKVSDMANQSSNGTYWIKSQNMPTAQQYYVDYTNTTGGPWIRIWLAASDNYNQSSGFTWDNAASSSLLLDCGFFMYAFVNTANNSLTYPWAFRFADSTTLNGSSDGNKSAFFSSPPMNHGGAGSPLITNVYAIRLADSSVTTQYLRTGNSSFGSTCDQGRSGTWGQICLKSLGAGDTTGGGYSDFPHYTSFAYSGTDNWARSDQGYTTGSVDSTKRFGVYCKLL